MTFEEYIVDYYPGPYGYDFVERTWNEARRTDPIKHMLYIALIEVCETAEVSESIRKALKAYEEERQDG